MKTRSDMTDHVKLKSVVKMSTVKATNKNLVKSPFSTVKYANPNHIIFGFLCLVNYMASFEVVAVDSCIDGFDDLELNSVSVDECADACVTSTEMYCRGFGYQLVSNNNGYFLTCYLTRVNPTTVNNTMYKQSPGCTTYSSQFFVCLFVLFLSLKSTCPLLCLFACLPACLLASSCCFFVMFC